MSTTIDQRVVEMRFDNKQFESATRTSMSTLDKLKQSLNLTGASKGLENISAAAKKVDFSQMEITATKAGFHIQDIWLKTATFLENNIARRIVNIGTNMAKALTIDPIKTGFQEYETQINAVQTILANTSSKGTTLQQVNSALDTLNTYADKTIYNFTEMTRNIGTFTAAGVDLDKSVSAIQGIANLAAISGSSSQQASTAMYQLSQALAAGRVSLMDWNSVVNAGMGGQVFQDALKRTAKNMGIVVDESKSFRDSISGKDTWLSADVLIKTLEQFTLAAEEGSAEWDKFKKSLMDEGYTEEQAVSILKMANTATDAATKVKTFTQLWDTLKESAQSGWTQSWEIIVGDFGEAKEELTKISETIGSMIGASAEARNKLLSGGLSSGWKQLLGAGIADESGYQESIKTIAKEHGVAFDEIIKKTEEAGGTFEDALISCLKDGSITSDMMTESVTHLADGMRNMTEEERDAAGYTVEHINAIEELEKGLKNGSISMDEFVTKMTRLSGRQNIIQALWNSFNGLLEIVKPIKEAFREVFPPMTGEQLYALTEKLRELTEKFKISGTTANNIKRIFKGLFSVLDIGIEAVKSIASGILQLFGSFKGLGSEVLNTAGSFGDWLSNLRNTIKETDIFGKAVDKIAGFLTNVISKIKEFGQSLKVGLESPDFASTIDFFKGLWSIVTKVGSAIVNTFGNLGRTISEVLGKGDIFEVLNSGVLVGILLSVQKFTSNLGEAFENVGGFMENVTGILDDVRGCFEAYQTQLKAGALIKIAAAIGILAAALFVISTIDSNSLGNAILGITFLFVELVTAMEVMDKFGVSTKLFDTTAGKMVGMSLSILILASALKSLSGLSWEQMSIGLVGISVLLWELVAISTVMSKTDSEMVKGSLGLIALAGAIKILASACKDFATMSWEDIGKGLAAIGGLLIGISIFEIIAGKAEHVVRTGISIALIAASLKILANALTDFSSMKWNDISKGLFAMGIALAELAITMKLMPNGSVFKAAGLLIAITSLKLLASALSDFGNMEWSSLGKGLIVIGSALFALAIGLNCMKGTLGGAAALLVASAALAIIVPVMTTLGKMSWGEIAKGLVALAGAFIVIGVAGLLLQPLIGPILGLAAAFVVLGVGMLGIGAGITLVATGISALAVALSTGAASIVAALTVIVTGILQLIPTIARIIGEGIVELAKILGDYAPQLADSFLQLLTSVLQSLAEHAPQITDALFELLIGVINSLSNHTPALIEALINLFANVFKGFVDALKNIGMNNLRDGIDTALGLSALMLAMGLALKVAGSVSIGSAIKGILALTAMVIPLITFVGVLALADGIDNAMNNAMALSLLISACSLMLLPLTLVGSFIVPALLGVTALTAMAIPLLAFVGILALMDKVDNAMSNAILLGSFMLIMSDVLIKVSLVAPLALLGVTAMTALTLLMGAIGILVVGIGALMDKFPSLQKFLDTGLPILEQLAGSIGTMIGKFVSGIGEGLGDTLVKMGEDIAEFMNVLAVASENASGIKGESFDGVKDLMSVMGDIAATTVGTTIGDIFTLGGTSMEKFQTDGVAFFNAMKEIGKASSEVKINEEAMSSVISVAQALADLQSSLEPIGGVITWFTGRDDLGTFGVNAGLFISSMKDAFGSLDGVVLNTEAMDSIVTAATSLADLQHSLEPIGGVITWFTGRDDLGTFGVNVGLFIRSIGTAFSSLDDTEFNTEAMNSIVSAATSLADLQHSLEPIGGVITWFTGRDDLGTFGINIAAFTSSMKTAFSFLDDAEFNTEAMNSIVSAATSLANLQNSLEPIGGVISWFTGRDDLGTFGINVGLFISSMKTAFTSLDGVEFNTEAMNSIVSAATSLANLQNSLEPIGGVITWFTGRDDLGTFGYSIGQFIYSMKTAFTSLDGVEFSTEAMDSIISAATSLAGLQSNLEPMGGVVSWFTGRDDLGTFGTNIGLFADAMGKLKTGMGENGISEEVVTSVTNAGNAIIELQKALPEEGWFDGKMNLSDFSGYITDFSTAMSDFSAKAVEIDTGAVSTVISTAHRIKGLITSLVDLDTSGIEKFTGVGSGGIGADGAAYKIAQAIVSFSDEVTDIDTSAVSTSVSTAQKLKSLITSLVDLDTSGIDTFANVESIGSTIKSYADSVTDIDTSSISTSISNAKRLVSLINSMADLDTSGVDSFKSAITKLANTDTSGIATAFKDLSKFTTIGSNIVNAITNGINSKQASLSTAGTTLANNLQKGITSKNVTILTAINKLISDLISRIHSRKEIFNSTGVLLMSRLASGMTSQSSNVKGAASNVLKYAVSGMTSYYGDFYNAGSYLVSGFANGISANSYKAAAQAKAMAKAAADAAEEALDINSPSKVFRAIGYSVPEGFAMGIDKLAGMVRSSSVSMTDVAVDSVKSTLASLAEAVTTDIDSQPTIRPVLDLSDVQSGAAAISGLFSDEASVGVMSNVGSIGNMMNNRQNGSNDVVSAIDKLRNDLSNIGRGGDTYNVNGVTYTSDDEVADAIKVLTRAVRVEGRI